MEAAVKRIAIIEDDVAMNQGIRLTLGEQDYEFFQYYDLAETEHMPKVDLVIMDLNLPDGNGLDFLKKFRKKTETPVLILTAEDSEMNEVMGLQIGADDYVTKPFRLMVLRLRVEKLLQKQKKEAVYRDRELYLDFHEMRFERLGNPVELSRSEIRLLRVLLENEGQILTREKLIRYIWGQQEFVEENALSVTVKRLRDKLESVPGTHIVTSYGIGYMWKWI